MVKDEQEYAHLVAAQVLCDISLQVNLHAIMSTNGSIDILANMVNNKNDDISRLAAIALKNVLVTPSCQVGYIHNKYYCYTYLLCSFIDGNPSCGQSSFIITCTRHGWFLHN